MKYLGLIFFVSTIALAKEDPNITHEGNKPVVNRNACLKYGGHVSANDRRYFICEGGKYDGHITEGPASEPEGDDQETGQP